MVKGTQLRNRYNGVQLLVRNQQRTGPYSFYPNNYGQFMVQCSYMPGFMDDNNYTLDFPLVGPQQLGIKRQVHMCEPE